MFEKLNGQDTLSKKVYLTFGVCQTSEFGISLGLTRTKMYGRVYHMGPSYQLKSNTVSISGEFYPIHKYFIPKISYWKIFRERRNNFYGELSALFVTNFDTWCLALRPAFNYEIKVSTNNITMYNSSYLKFSFGYTLFFKPNLTFNSLWPLFFSLSLYKKPNSRSITEVR